jgi:hypothetical protein
MMPGMMRALRSQSAGMLLAAALVVGFVLEQLLTHAGFPGLLTLSAADVRLGRVWQPLTYAVLERDPVGVLFGALVAWSMGRVLELTWGSRRVVAFALSVTALAGGLTVLASFAWGGLLLMRYGGGTVLTSALWLAYGWSWGSRQTNFWGIPVSGNVLAGIGLLFLGLNALQAWSLVPVFPHLLAAALTYAYTRFGSPLGWWNRLRAWRLHRQLRARASHLKVVDGQRGGGRGSDRYLH